MEIEVLDSLGKPCKVKVTVYSALRSGPVTWLMVTDGRGRHWRIKKAINK